MGIAVLPPRDDVFHHSRLISPPRSKARRTTTVRRKQRNPSDSPPPQSKSNDVAKAKAPVLSGQIRILKRGEDLPPTKISTAVTTPVKSQKEKSEGSVERANSDPVALSTYRKSPQPDPVPFPNIFVAGFYAGSAFSASPPPSSLPLPGFCSKLGGSTVEDVVALDLRRILRIEE